MLVDQQKALELKYSKVTSALQLESHKEEFIKPCMEFFHMWCDLHPKLDRTDRPDLDDIEQGVLAFTEPEEVIWRILSNSLIKGSTTLQQVVGMYWDDIEVENNFRKGRVMEPFVTAVLKSPFVELKQGDKYLEITAKHALKQQFKNSYVLPCLYPHAVKTNWDAGYEHEKFHVITGGKDKQHNGEVCLDHINRMAHTGYSLNTRVMFCVENVFDPEPKFVDKKGRYETAKEVIERENDFYIRQTELPERINDLVKLGNKFYFHPRYDYRGRTYLKAYHFDFIGDKYMRAITESTTKQVVEGADKYFL